MLGIQGINQLIIIVSAMTSQGLRGPDIDWEGKFEVVNAFRR